ncbi:MAG: S-adenosylmethionine decarboxylase [Gammaproteobacteria bacterium]|jgi:S-adenosylmethionine decarboxylase
MKSKKREHVFGYQLLLDLYDCKEGVCDDLALCYKFLDDMVDKLDMKKQSPPYIFRSDASKFPSKAGLSGWAPLIESSIVIHTLSVKNYISIDIYCCKYFETAMAKEVCKKFFSPQRMDEHFIERGQDYYKADSTYHTLTVNHKRPHPHKVLLRKKKLSTH